MESDAGGETPFSVKLRVAFTSGHIYPALAIHDVLRARHRAADEHEARFFGNEDGLEATLVKNDAASVRAERAIAARVQKRVSP